MKKIFLIITLLFLFSAPTFAADTVNIYFFWAQGCPHCVAEKEFLESLKQKYPQVVIKSYEVTGSRENAQLLQKIGQKLNTDVSGVPFTIVGKYHFAGYLNDQTTGQKIEEAVQCATKEGCGVIADQLIHSLLPESPPSQTSQIPAIINLPFLNQIQIKNLSLPALTFIIALLDGFNPCAMWVLLFLISLLLGMKDRQKMWLLGTTFIAASAFVYFLFISTWLNLFLFLGFVLWVRILIGLVALATGSYNLRDYFINKGGGCEIVADEKRERMFSRMRRLTSEKRTLLALAGMVVLAFSVNLIELVCSAGLPAIYTQILSLSKLPTWQYYLYLLFYILIFMADDLFVFFIAMTTLKMVGIEKKYSRASRLLGGTLMLLIGLLLLFKPELLMFG